MMEVKEMEFVKAAIDMILEHSSDLLIPHLITELKAMRNKAILNDADYATYFHCLTIINKGI